MAFRCLVSGRGVPSAQPMATNDTLLLGNFSVSLAVNDIGVSRDF